MGTYLKRLAMHWLLVVATALLAGVGLAGYNRLSSTFSLARGWRSVADLFGGLASFGALLGALLATTLVVGGLVYVARYNYTGKQQLMAVHVFIGVVVVIAAAVIGVRWIDLPSGSGWMALVVLTATLVAAWLHDAANRLFKQSKSAGTPPASS